MIARHKPVLARFMPAFPVGYNNFPAANKLAVFAPIVGLGGIPWRDGLILDGKNVSNSAESLANLVPGRRIHSDNKSAVSSFIR